MSGLGWGPRAVEVCGFLHVADAYAQTLHVSGEENLLNHAKPSCGLPRSETLGDEEDTN